jgi:hypothetical protein
MYQLGCWSQGDIAGKIGCIDLGSVDLDNGPVFCVTLIVILTVAIKTDGWQENHMPQNVVLWRPVFFKIVAEGFQLFQFLHHCVELGLEISVTAFGFKIPPLNLPQACLQKLDNIFLFWNHVLNR